MGGTSVFSRWLQYISSTLNQLNGIASMSVPPYILVVVGNFDSELFVVDSHVIREELGGIGNGAIINFGKDKYCLQ